MQQQSHASSASISAQNTFTTAITVTGGVATLVVSGTFAATVVLQIRAPEDADGAAWANADTGWSDITNAALTAAGQWTTVELGGAWQVRAGVKTGGYTSGTAKVWLRSNTRG